MPFNLNTIEIRILGCLIEKERTTPEYYPLSLNSLTNACNQKSNRDPVMNLTEEDVADALDRLRFQQLAVVSADGGRVPKYRHILAEKLGLVPAELAILSELLVRGPQTVGELRTRCDRMHSFGTLENIEETLDELMKREDPLVARLARQPGRKEPRHAHLFAPVAECGEEPSEAPPEAARQRLTADRERLEKLEGEVLQLQGEVAELRRQLEAFRTLFQ